MNPSRPVAVVLVLLLLVVAAIAQICAATYTHPPPEPIYGPLNLNRGQVLPGLNTEQARLEAQVKLIDEHTVGILNNEELVAIISETCQFHKEENRIIKYRGLVEDFNFASTGKRRLFIGSAVSKEDVFQGTPPTNNNHILTRDSDNDPLVCKTGVCCARITVPQLDTNVFINLPKECKGERLALFATNSDGGTGLPISDAVKFRRPDNGADTALFGPNPRQCAPLTIVPQCTRYNQNLWTSECRFLTQAEREESGFETDDEGDHDNGDHALEKAFGNGGDANAKGRIFKCSARHDIAAQALYKVFNPNDRLAFYDFESDTGTRYAGFLPGGEKVLIGDAHKSPAACPGGKCKPSVRVFNRPIPAHGGEEGRVWARRGLRFLGKVLSDPALAERCSGYIAPQYHWDGGLMQAPTSELTTLGSGTGSHYYYPKRLGFLLYFLLDLLDGDLDGSINKNGLGTHDHDAFDNYSMFAAAFGWSHTVAEKLFYVLSHHDGTVQIDALPFEPTGDERCQCNFIVQRLFDRELPRKLQDVAYPCKRKCAADQCDPINTCPKDCDNGKCKKWKKLFFKVLAHTSTEQ